MIFVRLVCHHVACIFKNYDLLYNSGKCYSLCFKAKCPLFRRTISTLSHLNKSSTVNQSKCIDIIISKNNSASDWNDKCANYVQC